MEVGALLQAAGIQPSLRGVTDRFWVFGERSVALRSGWSAKTAKGKKPSSTSDPL